ncbi:hypothetical protein GCM10027185_40620 [Spirosoma pulveris]
MDAGSWLGPKCNCTDNEYNDELRFDGYHRYWHDRDNRYRNNPHGYDRNDGNRYNWYGYHWNNGYGYYRYRYL